MKITKDLYSGSLSLLTDLYQLTMAYGYWKAGKAEQEGSFSLFFRSNPFKGGFTIACGLEYVIDFLDNFKFTREDIDYLATLNGHDGTPLFEADFLDYLKNLKFTCHVHAVPEGRVVFPHQPILRVTGPLLQCQLIETPLLNIINFQTLIATKAARMHISAKGEPVLEFGLRRAQGIDGALAASRAAYIGGCTATSNLLAGKLFGIPVSGTHAHSWIMAFDDELEAFRTYAEVMPNNVVLLVDTFDTLQGIRHAITIGRSMKENGRHLRGIRIDSGDLAWFSQRARQLLDNAGLTTTEIVASNDLDEYIISSLKEQDAKVSIWGIGTKLVTAYDQPALGAVYKMCALKNGQGQWTDKIKLSEQSIKVNTPGIQQTRRFTDSAGRFIGDMVYDVESGLPDEVVIVDPMDATRRKRIPEYAKGTDLLLPVFEHGQCVYTLPPIGDVRRIVQADLKALHPGIKRFINPHSYPMGLEAGLHKRKTDLILELRG